VPLRSAAPSGGAGGKDGGPLLVPLSPKEKDSNEDSEVRIVSSVGEASRGRSPPPPALGHEAPCDEGKSSSTSTSLSSSSSENIGQSVSPSATGAQKNDFVATAGEDEEEEEPESSNYRVTLEEPQATAARLQIPPEAKLIGGKQIRFLGLIVAVTNASFWRRLGQASRPPTKRNTSETSALPT
jgi:hypothetical protein